MPQGGANQARRSRLLRWARRRIPLGRRALPRLAIARTLSAEERWAQARRVDEILAQTDAVVAGRLSRADAKAWAEQVSRGDGYSYIVGNGAAYALYGVLWNVTERDSDGELIAREQDLIALAREVRDGSAGWSSEPIAILSLTVADLAARLSVPTVRFLPDGLDWQESLQLASRATGRTFAVTGALRPLVHRTSDVYTVAPMRETEALPAIIEDLFDTLGIDADETFELAAPLRRRWELLRTDDNANTFVIGSFTSYAKARARKDALEAHIHKQTYWIEERPL